MAARFVRLFSLPPDCYTPGSPVVISAGVLSKDTLSDKLIVQLKFTNIQSKTIKAVKVVIREFDIVGKLLSDDTEKDFLDFSAGRNAVFGQKMPIYLKNNTCRSFNIKVLKVIFEDNTQIKIHNADWKEIPHIKLEDEFSNEQILTFKQKFRIAESECIYYPQKIEDIWVCTCGTINKNNEEKCYSCGCSYSELADISEEELTYYSGIIHLQNKDYQKAINKFSFVIDYKDAKEKLEEAKKEQAAFEKAKKKRKKLFIIAASVICVTLILLFSVIIPGIKHHEAMKMIESGDYDSAYAILKELGKDDEIISCEYDRAIKAIKRNDYLTAYNLLNGLNYKDSKEKLNNIKKKLSQNSEVGSVVAFGMYEQDNDKSNGKEDILWQILAKENNKLLLISCQVLDYKPYNTDSKFTTWEKSSLRKWLNKDFLNTAFTKKEQAKIQNSYVPADKNPECDINPGNATNDKIFLLSITEADKYFYSSFGGMCDATKYTIAQSSYLTATWLRTPSVVPGCVAFISVDGSINIYSRCNINKKLGVRPAMWINLE